MEKFLNVAEVARQVGCSRKTVRRWIAAGVLPSLQASGGGHHRIPVSALDQLTSSAWAATGRSAPTPVPPTEEDLTAELERLLGLA